MHQLSRVDIAVLEPFCQRLRERPSPSVLCEMLLVWLRHIMSPDAILDDPTPTGYDPGPRPVVVVEFGPHRRPIVTDRLPGIFVNHSGCRYIPISIGQKSHYPYAHSHGGVEYGCLWNGNLSVTVVDRDAAATLRLGENVCRNLYRCADIIRKIAGLPVFRIESLSGVAFLNELKVYALTIALIYAIQDHWIASVPNTYTAGNITTGGYSP